MVCMKKKIKGFTLTELLAVIVVLGLLTAIVIIMYLQYIDRTKENIVKIEERNIINSVSAYYDEFKDTLEYTKEDVYEGDTKKTYSCVTLKSLIEKGYFKNDVNFSKTEITKEDTIIKISTVDGVTNYEIINDYDSDNVCKYYKMNTDFDSVSTVTAETNNSITFDSSVSNIEKKKDLYSLNLGLTLDITELAANFPVYVLIVMDKSGSMAGDKYNKAKSAAITLSQSVVGINDNAYIGKFEFDNQVSQIVEFRHSVLTSSDFGSAGGNTNIVAGMDQAIEMMSAVPDTAIKYVIFLTDGYPVVTTGEKHYRTRWLPYEYSHYAICASSKVSAECKRTLINYRNRLEELNAKLVVIGYGLKIADYKEVASVDSSGFMCPNPTIYNGEKHCYYESDSDNIATLFSSISEAILNVVGNINTGKLRGKFNSAITVYDKDTGEEVRDLVIDISFDRNAYINTSSYKYMFKVNGRSFECDDTNCVFNSPLVENLTLDLYSQNDVYLQTLNLPSPTLKIDATKDSYLN